MTAPPRMREVAQNIDAFGQHLFQIFGEGTEPGFTYSIGNADRGLPELLLIGDFPSRIAAGLLNDLGAKMREDGKPIATGPIDIGWSIPLKIRRTGPLARSRYTIQVDRYLATTATTCCRSWSATKTAATRAMRVAIPATTSIAPRRAHCSGNKSVHTRCHTAPHADASAVPSVRPNPI